MSEREKLIELLTKVQYLGGLEEKIADYLLANGVTIPVRCAECKMAGDADNTMMQGKVVTCKLYASRPIMRCDDYCSYGERKDNGHL